MRPRLVRLPTGIRVRVVESGPATGQAVLLVHGWGGSAYMFRHALRALGESGYHAVALDLRGHGLSDKPVGRGMYTTGCLLADLRAAANAIGLDRFAVVGQSMGGALALRLALAEGDRVTHVMLINPAGLSGIPALQIGRLFRSPVFDYLVNKLPPRWLIRRILHVAYGDARQVQDDAVDEYWAPSQFPDYARAMRALTCEFDWHPIPPEHLGALRAPTVVIIGSADRLIRGALRTAERLRNVKLVTIAGAGHIANEERPDEVNAVLLDLLTQAPRTSAHSSGLD